jgi:hypothetical protein
VRAGVVLAVLGVVLAAALGFAAHVVAQDTIGLPAVSLQGGRPLAPEEARPSTTTKTEHATTEQETETETETHTRTVGDNGGSSSGPGSGEPGDDSSGHGRNRGPGGGDD